MSDLFKGKYRIPSTRFAGYDYGSHGLYYVTICTKNRACYFGDIVDVETQNFASLHLWPTEMGDIAHQCWLEIPQHFPFVELDEFVIMPNHVHGILFFNRPDYRERKSNAFGPQSKNLGSVIRGYKTGVKKYATIHGIAFSWQPRYHNHIIRSGKALNNIRQYIIDNPANWNNDKFNPGDVEMQNTDMQNDNGDDDVETQNLASLRRWKQQKVSVIWLKCQVISLKHCQETERPI